MRQHEQQIRQLEGEKKKLDDIIKRIEAIGTVSVAGGGLGGSMRAVPGTGQSRAFFAVAVVVVLMRVL